MDFGSCRSDGVGKFAGLVLQRFRTYGATGKRRRDWAQRRGFFFQGEADEGGHFVTSPRDKVFSA